MKNKKQIRAAFARWLAGEIQSRTMSLADVGRMTGLGRRRISEYVRGTRYPSPRSLRQLMSGLETDIPEECIYVY